MFYYIHTQLHLVQKLKLLRNIYYWTFSNEEILYSFGITSDIALKANGQVSNSNMTSCPHSKVLKISSTKALSTLQQLHARNCMLGICCTNPSLPHISNTSNRRSAFINTVYNKRLFSQKRQSIFFNKFYYLLLQKMIKCSEIRKREHSI